MLDGIAAVSADDGAPQKRGSVIPSGGPEANDTEKLHWLSAGRVACMVLLVGVGVLIGVLFAEYNTDQRQDETQLHFDSEATLVLQSVLTSIQAASSAADVMRTFMLVRNGSATADEFGTMAHMMLTTAEATAYQYTPHVLNESRAAFEEELALYWNARLGTNRSYPIQDSTAAGLAPAADADDYYAIKYMEPADSGTIDVIGFNVLSMPWRRPSLEALTRKPGVFGPFKIEGEVVDHALAFVIQLSLGEDIVVAVLRMPDVVRSALAGMQAGLDVHIFAASEGAELEEGHMGPSFGHFHGPGMNLLAPVTSQSLALSSDDRLWSLRSTSLVGRTWTVVVVANEDFAGEKPGLYVLPLLSVVLFFVTLAVISLYAWRSAALILRRETHLAADRAASESRAVAAAERQLNDFLAHEVRNPLSTAISAAEFVKVAIKEAHWPAQRTKEDALHDTALIAASLRFIHELLDNIINVNKFASGSFPLRKVPISIVHDVLEPVKAMLERRGVQIVVGAGAGANPDPCWVVADGLLLKQCVMNLAKNSSKFVERGYIRLQVRRVDATSVLIQVQDSGPGVPVEHRAGLFAKYQESLDQLRQGSGIGLCLVKLIVESMRGTVAIDNAYVSDCEGCPGAGFDIHLPLQEFDRDAELELADASPAPSDLESSPPVHESHNANVAAPASSMAWLVSGSTSTSVASPISDHDDVMMGPMVGLIVDDDSMTRLQLVRRLNGLFPRLALREVASGEAAIGLVNAGNAFDVIFMDHYMPGPDQPLTGTQTVRELRARGVQAKIIGCSGNDVAAAHLDAGVDAFLRKPFGSDDELRATVQAVMRSERLGNVLIVDDSDANRAMLERALKGVSPCSKFTHAASGEEALAKLEQETFDVLFADEHMGTDFLGSNLATAVRNNSQHSRMILVSLSGSDGSHCLKDVFDIVLRRPMAPVKTVARQVRDLQVALPPLHVNVTLAQ